MEVSLSNFGLKLCQPNYLDSIYIFSVKVNQLPDSFLPLDKQGERGQCYSNKETEQHPVPVFLRAPSRVFPRLGDLEERPSNT